MIRLRATNERVQRSVAPVVRSTVLGSNDVQTGDFARFGGFTTVATAVLTNAIAWTAKPCVASPAPMHGKYYHRRLQEFLT